MKNLFFTGASLFASGYAARHAYTGKCESNLGWKGITGDRWMKFIFKHTVIAAWYHLKSRIKQFPSNFLISIDCIITTGFNHMKVPILILEHTQWFWSPRHRKGSNETQKYLKSPTYNLKLALKAFCLNHYRKTNYFHYWEKMP